MGAPRFHAVPHRGQLQNPLQTGTRRQDDADTHTTGHDLTPLIMDSQTSPAPVISSPVANVPVTHVDSGVSWTDDAWTASSVVSPMHSDVTIPRTSTHTINITRHSCRLSHFLHSLILRFSLLLMKVPLDSMNLSGTSQSFSLAQAPSTAAPVAPRTTFDPTEILYHPGGSHLHDTDEKMTSHSQSSVVVAAIEAEGLTSTAVLSTQRDVRL